MTNLSLYFRWYSLLSDYYKTKTNAAVTLLVSVWYVLKFKGFNTEPEVPKASFMPSK
jgi:hypothetical protein